MKKVKALFGALAIAAAVGFVSCYTDSQYEEPEANQGSKTNSGDNSSNENGQTQEVKFKNITMKLIKGGSFKFGDDEKKVESFYIAETETTQKLYKTIMGDKKHESTVTGDDYPVDKMRFYATLVFCNKLSLAEGLTPVYKKGNETDSDKWGDVPTADNAEWNAITEDSSADGFRLPHKDEWVYAALGNNASKDSGDYKDYYAGCIGKDNLSEYAWCDETSAAIHQVKQKKANSNGLYDMSGNCWELCWDRHNDSNDKHIRIGGDSKDCIALSEAWDYATNNDWGQVGFRVVCSASAKPGAIAN